MEKQCSDCMSFFKMEEFVRISDGIKFIRCRQCRRIKARIYFNKYYHSENGNSIIKKCIKKYLATNKGKDKQRRDSQKYHFKYPEKRKAKRAVYYLVEKGIIPRPALLPCLDCTGPAKHYHHYAGYSNENIYKVVPLCFVCHSHRHLR